MDGQNIFKISDTQLDRTKGYVWHIGTLEEYRTIEPGKRVKVQPDVERRISLMQNHTGAHLLNCALHQMFEFTRQKALLVTPYGFKFDFISLNAVIDAETVFKIGTVHCI